MTITRALIASMTAIGLLTVGALPARAADGPNVGAMTQCADPGPFNTSLYTSVDCESARAAMAALKKLGAKRASAQGFQCFWREGQKSAIFCTLPAKKSDRDGRDMRFDERMSANSALGGGAFGTW